MTHLDKDYLGRMLPLVLQELLVQPRLIVRGRVESIGVAVVWVQLLKLGLSCGIVDRSLKPPPVLLRQYSSTSCLPQSAPDLSQLFSRHRAQAGFTCTSEAICDNGKHISERAAPPRPWCGRQRACCPRGCQGLHRTPRRCGQWWVQAD